MYSTYKLYLNSLIPRTDDCHTMVGEYAAEVGMGAGDELRLELLTEETVGMVCAMVEEFEAELWLEGDSRFTAINLDVISRTDADKKERSSNGRDGDAPKGFMAKLGELLQCAFYFDSADAVPEAFLDAIPDYMSLGIDKNADSPLLMGQWSLTSYREALKAEQSADAGAALDELEKSIVANIADDVTVGIKDERIKLVITKRFAE